MTIENGSLLQLKNLKKHFPVAGNFMSSLTGKKTWLKAVDGIDLSIEAGTTYGLVGVSGCGKSTTAKMVLMLEKPTEGEILFEGENALGFDKSNKKGINPAFKPCFKIPGPP